jgi:hypothetical protein
VTTAPFQLQGIHFSAQAHHKIFDNKFFLKYIQYLGLRKISHLPGSHQWAFAPPKSRKSGGGLSNRVTCILY